MFFIYWCLFGTKVIKKNEFLSCCNFFFDINKCVATIKYQNFCCMAEGCFKNEVHVWCLVVLKVLIFKENVISCVIY